MRTVKVAITMDEDVVVEARRLAGEGGLSAFVNALDRGADDLGTVIRAAHREGRLLARNLAVPVG